MMGIALEARKMGHNCITSSAPKKCSNVSNHYTIGTSIERKINIVVGKAIGYEYKLSLIGTKLLIDEIQRFNPDIIHFHNLHSYFVNINMLINYINSEKYRVIWTFHDCWPITGHCPHFLMEGCQKWTSGCINCTQYRKYPSSMYDNSKRKFAEKRELFIKIQNLTIVTPSYWLKSVVEQSFLRDKKIVVINNGIDLNRFKPIQTNRIEIIKNRCHSKYALLGVASEWDERKGLDIFINLAKELDSQYTIILVGTNEKIDRLLPNNIVSVHHTQNIDELIELYSGSDIFVNPTREDTYPTVNMEALACGTPVVTFNVGGSPEILTEECGCVVEANDTNALVEEIKRICKEAPYSQSSCLKRARLFNKTDKFREYISLYEEIV